MACEFLVDSPRWLAQREGDECRVKGGLLPLAAGNGASITASLPLISSSLLPHPPNQHGKWSEAVAAVEQLLGEAKHGKWTEAEAAVAQLLGEAKVDSTMDDLHHSFGGSSKGCGAGWEAGAKGEKKEGKGEQQGRVYAVLGEGEKGKGVAVAGKGEEEGLVKDGGVVEKVTWRSLFSKRYVREQLYSTCSNSAASTPYSSSPHASLLLRSVSSLSFPSLYFPPPSPGVTIGATLFALQQLSGINALFFFSSHLFLLVNPLPPSPFPKPPFFPPSCHHRSNTIFPAATQRHQRCILLLLAPFPPCQPTPSFPFRKTPFLPPPVVTIGATLFALQQLSGINAVFFFSSHLFKSAGIQSGAMASVAMGTLNLVGECT
ncbi:unnamed protein product [Closterium sp. NIES-54]